MVSRDSSPRVGSRKLCPSNAVDVKVTIHYLSRTGIGNVGTMPRRRYRPLLRSHGLTRQLRQRLMSLYLTFAYNWEYCPIHVGTVC